MGDLGEYWNDLKQAKHDEGWVSNQYRTDKHRERGTEFKGEVNSQHDDYLKKLLAKLGLNPEFKNTHSFQITINGRVGMYYGGKNEKIRFNDGEVVELGYPNTLKAYLATYKSTKEGYQHNPVPSSEEVHSYRNGNEDYEHGDH